MHGKGEVAPFVVLMQTHALWGEDTPQTAEDPLNTHTMHGCGKRSQGCPYQMGSLSRRAIHHLNRSKLSSFQSTPRHVERYKDHFPSGADCSCASSTGWKSSLYATTLVLSESTFFGCSACVVSGMSRAHESTCSVWLTCLSRLKQTGASAVPHIIGCPIASLA